MVLASKIIVHLHCGQKDATKISFDGFLESRLKHDVSVNAESVFEEINGFQWPQTVPTPTPTPTPGAEAGGAGTGSAGADSAEADSAEAGNAGAGSAAAEGSLKKA